MSDKDDVIEEKVKDEGDKQQKVRDFIDTAMKRLKIGFEADNHNRREAIEDLNFLNGDQWDADEKKRREVAGRPALIVNHLNKYVDQIVGDMRQNRVRVKVRPVGSKSDVAIAKIRSGLIANIEYQSNAATIYDEAGTSMVECGYGAWRVLTRYTEEDPFLQEAYLEGIPNPFVVIMDPNAKDFMYADADWGFILEKMPEDEFKLEYPGKDMPSTTMEYDDGLGFEHWYSENLVTVAEYFVREKEKVPMCLMADGQVLGEEDAAELESEWLAQFGPILAVNPEANTPEKPEIIKTRDAEVYKVRHYKMTSSEILSKDGIKGEDFPGKYIPIVLIRGKKRNIEGKTFVRGLIREAKDPQRIINYWESSGAEVVALAPKNPWVGTPKQFEGFEDDYAAANVENFPFLKYNPDPEAQGAPHRVGFGEVPIAIFTQIQRAGENLKTVVGMFNRDVGDTGPEVTGKAILAAQRPGDTATYVYPDNRSKGIAHSGRILNEIIPAIYDSERDIRVRHFDDTESFVPINTTVSSAISTIKQNPGRYLGMDPGALIDAARKGGGDAAFNDIAAGKFDVVIEVGPSYATQRQEAAENLLRLVNSDPQIMRVASDLVVRNLDFKDSDELESRLRRALPPGLAKPREGDEPDKPLPPSFEQQIEKLKLEFQAAKTDAEKMRLEIQRTKLLKEAQEVKSNIRKEIIEVLKELHAPNHPADNVIHGKQG